jgi:ubiquinone/menaquinone biosynthesis C-methylase UbiE
MIGASAAKDLHRVDIEKYYRAQIDAHSVDVLRDDASRQHSETWFRDDTADYWRHDRMRRQIEPLLDRNDRWITFGDGRYGTDAAWLMAKGQKVLCTDIQDTLLKLGHARGFIGDYRAANAEALPFADGEFDWGLCKEAYHHMPRPPVAFYEMLRVVRKGLVLIEPAPRQAKNLWGSLTLALLDRLHPVRAENEFEESGNYVYKLSIADVRQMLLGSGLRAFAYKTINDCYIKGVENEAPPGALKAACERNIRRRDLILKLLGLHGSLMVCIVFKAAPVAADALRAHGFIIVELPANPYQP